MAVVCISCGGAGRATSAFGMVGPCLSCDGVGITPGSGSAMHYDRPEGTADLRARVERLEGQVRALEAREAGREETERTR